MRYFKIIFFILFISFFCINLNSSCVFADDNWDNQDDFFDFYEDDFSYFEIQDVKIYDPLESYNRFIFDFNHVAYRVVFTPLSRLYDFFLPKRAQKKVDNFFYNIRMPVYFFNNIFQGKFESACSEFGRFIINSTAGIGGLFDPASLSDKLQKNPKDFGLTLGYYGFKPGMYIVWPLLGPSNIRDSIGHAGDLALDPLFWLNVKNTKPRYLYTGLTKTKYLHNYSYNVRDNYENIVKHAFDPYIAIQHAYIQRREKKIRE